MTNGDSPGRQAARASREEISRALEDALEREPGRLLAAVVRAVGDLDLAEECIQDAAVRAAEAWAQLGLPDNPAGWLYTAARRRAIDLVRRSRRWREKRAELEREVDLDGHPAADEAFAIPDERLRLIFTCCHPILPMESRVALTLRTVGGLSTAEVARALLTTESTMKQRLVRAKRRIRSAGVAYTVPSDDLLVERLGGVHAVLYLVFTEGYKRTSGDVVTDGSLCAEAIRLTRLVAEQLADPETAGLLALMLFQASRARTRTDAHGRLVLLQDQDRTRWDPVLIGEANRWLERAARAGAAGPYPLQAAIAAEHANARSADRTDWAQISRLYDRLVAAAPSPVFALNRAVAHGMHRGPAAGYALVESIEALDGYALFHATRADFRRRLERADEARSAYRRAISLTSNAVERRFLEERLRMLGGRDEGHADVRD